MEPKEKIELLEKTVKHLIEEDIRGRSNNLIISSNDYQGQISRDEEDGKENTHVLLSKMLSQLDSLKEDMLKQPQPRPPSTNAKSTTTTKDLSLSTHKSISKQEILKELRAIKKQNSRTHLLLSVMIGLTLVWQLSEVSAILLLKEGLTHPLRSIGSVLSGIFKSRGDSVSEQELEKDAEININKSQVPKISSYPGLMTHEIIPHAE